MWEFLLGGVFRLLPELGKLWEGDRLRKHELELLDKQLELDKARAEYKLDEIKVSGEIQLDAKDADVFLEAVKAQGQKTGIEWVDAWNAIIRPLITTWNVIVMYTAYKICSGILIFRSNLDVVASIKEIWTPTDQAIMLSIIGFWFVDRALRKLK